MGASLKLVSIRGIAIRLHLSFVLVIVWAAYIALAGSRFSGEVPWQRLAYAELFVILLFVCVALHELAHALTAQLFQVQVQDVTLWPLGGVARMARMPDDPFQEFIITAAGPAMSIFLTLFLGLILVASIGPANAVDTLLSPWLIGSMFGEANLPDLLFLLVINNALLAVFNLLPAFPLDGGRMLRALLASFMSFGRATGIAATVGQVVAGLLLVGSLVGPNVLLALVAIFMFFVAGQERRQAITDARLKGLRVYQAMQPVGQPLHPLQTLGQAAALMANSSQAFFLVLDGGQLVGILSRGDILDGLRRHGPDARVMQQMTRDISRLSTEEPLADARERLAQSDSWVAVVVQGGDVIGTLSQGDLNRVADLVQAYPGALPRT
jgi:Zn-dependent protease/CBS domain-containing protein